jgi:hypothetical protein
MYTIRHIMFKIIFYVLQCQIGTVLLFHNVYGLFSNSPTLFLF